MTEELFQDIRSQFLTMQYTIKQAQIIPGLPPEVLAELKSVDHHYGKALSTILEYRNK